MMFYSIYKSSKQKILVGIQICWAMVTKNKSSKQKMLINKNITLLRFDCLILKNMAKKFLNFD